MATQDDNTILSKADLKAYHQKILPFLGGNAFLSTNHSDYYSTDEKMVGVWTDGKPVYQKTFIISKSSFTKVSDYRYEYSISSLNIDKLVKADSVASVGTDGQGASPGITFTNTSINNSWNYGVLVIKNKIIMTLQADVVSNGGFSSVTATIQYTKTTDTTTTALTTPGAYDLNRPDLWPANKEIFFGDGLYGCRTTGTYDTTAGTRGSIVLVSLTNASTTKIMNFGGTIKRSQTSSNRSDVAVGQVFTNGTSGSVVNNPISNITIEPNGITMWYKENDTISNIPYDIWIAYIK